VGDPTTIGYPSKPGVPRQSTDGKIPDIPSIPISFAEALPLLKALNGHGPKASSMNYRWQSGGLTHRGVEYNIGPTPDDVQIHLMNEQDYVITPGWNVIGVINGSISDEVVVLGNHRDAWIAGGAGDPNSGSAALNEVVRAFGKAVKQGWKPLRTIVFASWDGEEYGLLGSTEWVEEYLPWLREATVAYVNVDVGARGPQFGVSAAPLLNKAIYEVSGEVQSPNQTVQGQTVRDTWSGYISTMGSGSDFTAFQDFAGIPSIDIGFGAGSKDPVYHYHSNYDSFHWMNTFGDPGFKYHATMAKILGLLTAKLAEEPVVQFNATDYALGLQRYLESVKDKVASTGESEQSLATFKPLDKAIDSFQKASTNFDQYAADLSTQLSTATSNDQLSKLYQSIRSVNTKYKILERQFLYEPGLDDRSWFKHVVFAPGRWTGYAGATYPGIVESIDDKNQTNVERWVDIIETTINKATDLLIPQ
jgi:N-acetylated-alpha-linked acidic dipeptidase